MWKRIGIIFLATVVVIIIAVMLVNAGKKKDQNTLRGRIHREGFTGALDSAAAYTTTPEPLVRSQEGYYEDGIVGWQQNQPYKNGDDYYRTEGYARYPYSHIPSGSEVNQLLPLNNTAKEYAESYVRGYQELEDVYTAPACDRTAIGPMFLSKNYYETIHRNNLKQVGYAVPSDSQFDTTQEFPVYTLQGHTPPFLIIVKTPRGVFEVETNIFRDRMVVQIPGVNPYTSDFTIMLDLQYQY